MSDVVDDVAPEITIDEEYTIAKDYDLDILDMAQIEDNLDAYDDLEINVEGDVDTAKAGEFKITITAKDKAGNEASKDVLFTIVEGNDDYGSSSNSQSISGYPSGSEVYKGDGYQIITSGNSDVKITKDDGSLSITIN